MTSLGRYILSVCFSVLFSTAFVYDVSIKNVRFYIDNCSLSHRIDRILAVSLLDFSVVDFDITQLSFDSCVFVIYRHLCKKTLTRAVTVSDFQKSVWVYMETSFQAWAEGPFFSPPFYSPCLSEHRDSFL